MEKDKKRTANSDALQQIDVSKAFNELNCDGALQISQFVCPLDLCYKYSDAMLVRKGRPSDTAIIDRC